MHKAIEKVSQRLAAAYGDSGSAATTEPLARIIRRAREEGLDDAAIAHGLLAWLPRFALNRETWETREEALADLRRYLLALTAAPGGGFTRGLGAFAGWIFDHYAAVAGLAVAGATVLYGMAYADFYGALNTTPDRVGLSTAQVLVDSATGGFLLLTLIALGLFLMFVPMVAVNEAMPVKDPPQDMEPFYWHCAVSAGASILLFWLVVTLNPPVAWAAVAFVAQLFFFKTGFELRWRRCRPLVPRHIAFDFDDYLLLVVLVVPLATVATGVVTVSEAGNLGGKARAGEAVKDPSLMGVRFLNVRAETALVRVERSPASAPARCALYLGTTNNQVVLYDSAKMETVQLPARRVTLRFPRHRTSCEAPINLEPPVVSLAADGAHCARGRWRFAQDAEFTYAWAEDGRTIADGALLGREAVDEESIVRCVVTASTPLGDDTAAGEPVVVP